MSEKRLVWDLPLRLFHWLLVLSILASWYTAENSEEFIQVGEYVYSYTQIHYWLGYWALGLVLFRILWGFVGPRHARFSSFLAGPSKIAAYVRGFFRRDFAPSVGHNPLGAWVVLLFLLLIGAQAVTGLFLIDNTEIYPAPFHPSVDAQTASKLAAFHHFNFDVNIFSLIILHVVAILFYAFFKKQDLVGPMFSGRKRAAIVPENEAIAGSRWLWALAAIGVAALAVWLLLEQAPPPPSYEDYY